MALIPSEEKARMRDDALRVFTGKLRARGHVPLRQGFAFECFRCSRTAAMHEDAGFYLRGAMANEDCDVAPKAFAEYQKSQPGKTG